MLRHQLYLCVSEEHEFKANWDLVGPAASAAIGHPYAASGAKRRQSDVN
jgi:hypothetical protein